MIGTPANKEILREAGLLGDVGRQAGPGDLVIALRAKDAAAAEAAMAEARRLLDRPRRAAAGGAAWQPRTLRGAVQTDARRQPRAHFRARRFRRRRGQEGAAARPQRHDLLRQRAAGAGDCPQARGARSRAAAHGPRLRHRHHRRRAHRLRQRRSAGRYRHHRRFRHREFRRCPASSPTPGAAFRMLSAPAVAICLRRWAALPR